jgi:hypothetical protein
MKFEGSDGGDIFVTLESIDTTIINHIEKIIEPTVVDNGRTIRVPVIYASPERWKAIRKDGYLRDPMNDKAQTPLITVTRTNVSRNAVMTNPNNKYIYMTHQLKWNKRNAYDQFAILNNVTPSQEVRNIIVPDYVDLTYDIILWTEYVYQMNGLIEQLNVENDEYWGNRNTYKFRIKITDYVTNSELPDEDTRHIRTDFKMVVSAYLLPERMVRDFELKSTNSKYYTSKKFVLFSETSDFKPTPSK